MANLWQKISEIGVHPGLSGEEMRRVRLMNRLNFIAFDVLLLYLIVEVSMGLYSFIPYLALFDLCFMVIFFFQYKKQNEVAKHITMWTMIATISFFTITTGERALSEVLFIPLGAVPLIIMKKRWLAWSYLAIIVVCALVAKELQVSITPIEAIPDNVVYIFQRLNLATAACIAFLLTFYFRISNEQYEAELIYTGNQLEERNKDITDSIRYARRIQDAILPSDSIVQQHLPDSFIFYKPKDIVSGDFYWMKATGENTLIAAVDCTGHGVPGAFVSIVGNNGLNRAVNEFNLRQPAAILDKLNELVEETLMQAEGREVQDGMDIALCSLNTGRTILEYSGANNSLYLVQGGVLTEVKPDKQAIGGRINQRPFSNRQVSVSPGDCFYIFSDGFADQFGGPKGKKYKYKPFKELLLNIHKRPMSEQLAAINEAFEQWRGSIEQVDDVCVIGVRV